MPSMQKYRVCTYSVRQLNGGHARYASNFTVESVLTTYRPHEWRPTS